MFNIYARLLVNIVKLLDAITGKGTYFLCKISNCTGFKIPIVFQIPKILDVHEILTSSEAYWKSLRKDCL